MKLIERIAERQFGVKKSEVILVLKGGDNKPKKFVRMPHIDRNTSRLSYMCEEEAFDAIMYIPNKDVSFAGFSVYPALVLEP